MPDQDTTIADGDPGHATLHRDANIEINSLRSRAATLESTVSGHTTSIAAKYTKPAQGIPTSDFDTATQAKLTATVVFSANSTRPAGGMCIFTGSSDPGTNALPGDLWVGDMA